MREVTPGEVLSLREFLMMESTAMMNAKAALSVTQDKELRSIIQGAMDGCETRVKSLRRFIDENGIMSVKGGPV